MRVSEVFFSLSGEGIHAGIPTAFVRLTGCNLRCSYCDTKYAFEGGEELTVDEVLNRIAGWILGRWVLITGGEPLLQADAVNSLVFGLKYRMRLVEIETNGSIEPPSWFKFVDSWNVDVKCPSSGPEAYGSFKAKWLRRLRKQDQLKFVVGTEEDLDFTRGFIKGNRCRATMLISPIMNVGIDLANKDNVPDEIWYDVRWLQRVAEFCKEQNVRMSLQLHKIVWGNEKGK